MCIYREIYVVIIMNSTNTDTYIVSPPETPCTFEAIPRPLHQQGNTLTSMAFSGKSTRASGPCSTSLRLLKQWV